MWAECGLLSKMNQKGCGHTVWMADARGVGVVFWQPRVAWSVLWLLLWKYLLSCRCTQKNETCGRKIYSGFEYSRVIHSVCTCMYTYIQYHPHFGIKLYVETVTIQVFHTMYMISGNLISPPPPILFSGNKMGGGGEMRLLAIQTVYGRVQRTTVCNYWTGWLELYQRVGRLSM